jgi:hypothetical protein
MIVDAAFGRRPKEFELPEKRLQPRTVWLFVKRFSKV